MAWPRHPEETMRGALVFLCLVLGATAHPHKPQDESREQGQRMRLKYMQESLGDIKADMSNRLEMAKKVTDRIAILQKEVQSAEVTGCDDRWQFQCGGDHPKCISRLVVCDSQPDCPNAADENEECRVYTPAGSIWEGKMVYDTCTKRRPMEVRLTIDSYMIYDYLRSFPAITATLDFDPYAQDFDRSNSISLHGTMDLMVGNNIMYFGAPESDGLSVQCIFDGIDDFTCAGAIMYESNQIECAGFILERKDSYAIDMNM